MATEHAAITADGLVRRGVRLSAATRKADAVTCLQEAVRLLPEHAFGRLHLALALADEGRCDEALPHLREALESRPDSAPFHLFGGRVFFDAEDYPSARREFRRALELRPVNDLARNYAILTDWAAGSPGASQQLNPRDLPDSTPFLARLLMLIETEMAGRSAEFTNGALQLLWLDRPRVAYLLWRAERLRKRGRLAQAMSVADMVLEMHPGHPGAAAFQRECREAALSAAKQRAAEEPHSAEARLEFAFQLADAERLEEADRELAEAQRLAGEAAKRPEVLRLAGRILYGLGRHQEALDKIRAGAEPGFSMAETHYYLGLCYLALKKRMSCVTEFEQLLAKVWWAVPLRYREYLARREMPRRPSPQACAAQT